ncbi:hypothetical protein [Seonamhaeicola aphaedonensis]|nr:hypothetical protein [Seonamhaeicola aphaedonensis]
MSVILLNTSCSSDLDNLRKKCEDTYLLYLFKDCKDGIFSSFKILSLQEGNRIKNIIESNNEVCIQVNGTDNSGKSFEGFVITTSNNYLTIMDCNKHCYICPS